MKLFGKKSDDNNDMDLVEQPLYYWEEASYMLAIMGNEPVDIMEGVFDRIAGIDGVKLLKHDIEEEKKLGRVLLEYEGEEYKVGFYGGGFSIPSMIEDVERQQYFFTPEEINAISAANRAITIFMEFNSDSKKSYHLQIKLAVAIVPDLLAIMDESAEKLVSARWAKMAAESKVTPAAGDLYCIQGIQGEKGEVWLHTHGLCRCGLTELEVVDSNQENANNHYHVITTLAGMLLDKSNEEEEVPWRYIGNLSENLYLVVTYVPWTEGLKEYKNLTLGGAEDRKESHNSRSSIIFAYKNPEDAEAKRLSKITDYDGSWGENPLFFISNSETARMKALAMERFHFVKELSENPDNHVIIKIGLPVDDEYKEEGGDFEHIWFELIAFEGDKFKAKLLQEPYYIDDMHEGYEGYYTLEDVTDWLVYMEEFKITPDTAYLLM